jgi:tyrosyl-tRNA synthetase
MATSELDRQLELILRGTVEVIQLDELKAKLTESLKEHRPLKIKAGFNYQLLNILRTNNM